MIAGIVDKSAGEQMYVDELAAFLVACRTGNTAGLNTVASAARTLALLLEAKEWARR